MADLQNDPQAETIAVGNLDDVAPPRREPVHRARRPAPQARPPEPGRRKPGARTRTPRRAPDSRRLQRARPGAAGDTLRVRTTSRTGRAHAGDRHPAAAGRRGRRAVLVPARAARAHGGPCGDARPWNNRPGPRPGGRVPRRPAPGAERRRHGRRPQLRPHRHPARPGGGPGAGRLARHAARVPRPRRPQPHPRGHPLDAGHRTDPLRPGGRPRDEPPRRPRRPRRLPAGNDAPRARGGQGPGRHLAPPGSGSRTMCWACCAPTAACAWSPAPPPTIRETADHLDHVREAAGPRVGRPQRRLRHGNPARPRTGRCVLLPAPDRRTPRPRLAGARYRGPDLDERIPGAHGRGILARATIHAARRRRQDCRRWTPDRRRGPPWRRGQQAQGQKGRPAGRVAGDRSSSDRSRAVRRWGPRGLRAAASDSVRRFRAALSRRRGRTDARPGRHTRARSGSCRRRPAPSRPAPVRRFSAASRSSTVRSRWNCCEPSGARPLRRYEAGRGLEGERRARRLPRGRPSPRRRPGSRPPSTAA